MINYIRIMYLMLACCLLLFGGCGGKLAKTGCAVITDVACDGAMRIQYADGKSAWRKINPDDLPKASIIAQRHRFSPAKYVETRNGSTLTFADGETILYRDLY